jgi:two-component system chemotaxis sensor kinase CheA
MPSAMPPPAQKAGQASELPPIRPPRRIWAIEFQSRAKSEFVDNILVELAGLGQLRFLEDPRNGKPGRKKRAWKLELESEAGEAELRDLFEFTTDAEALTVSSREANLEAGMDSSSTAVDSEAYGFFDDQPVAIKESYGFFEDLPASLPDPTATTTTVESAYGFFTEIPAPQPESPSASAGATPAPVNFGRRSTDAAPFQSTPGRRDADKAAAQNSDASSIRVSIEKVDQLINLVGELVITQAMLAETVAGADSRLTEILADGMAQFQRNTRDLQESVMSIRMMPIAFVFSRYPRVVRDLASKLQKQVELKTVGEGTELDKGVIEKISDPLTHLVRNSLDHGIESPEVREAAGKPAKGTITLRAFHQGGNIVIEVSDDGAGLRRERILGKAKERGLPVNDNMTDQEVWALIFEPGFSTADVVTDVSGRGVGMDVVRRNIQSMGGRVEIDSSPGYGTRISIRLPLTLAILDGMSVAVDNEIFIVPLTFIVESMQPRNEEIRTVSGRGRVINVRGEYLPVFELHHFLGSKPKSNDYEKGIMLIVEAEGQKVAMFVDELVGQHQVVIKSLESNYRRVSGFSGATIMGDGRVAMILDVSALVKVAACPVAQAA